MNLYFDESGFTGYNLLDPQQPAFAVASTNIEPAEAEQILRTAFPRYQASEFKFSNIINSANEPGLRTLGDTLLDMADRIFVYVMDKKFAVFAKMVDFLIEPAITNAGYDFYANGFCRKYTNYIYVGLNFVAKEKFYDELVSDYLEFSRAPSADTLRELKRKLVAFERRADTELKIFLGEMITGADELSEHFDLDFFKKTNEIQLTTMVANVGRWRQRHNDDFHVIHDASSNFLRQKETWDAITNSDVPEQLHPLGDGTTVQFPLRVLSTTAVDSKDNYSIQLCDIIAGFATMFFRLKFTGVTGHAIQQIAAETGFGQIDFSGLMFTGEFPDFPPQRATGPDAVEQMTRIITRNMPDFE
jgi:hypothetical protein